MPGMHEVQGKEEGLMISYYGKCKEEIIPVTYLIQPWKQKGRLVEGKGEDIGILPGESEEILNL